MNLLKKFDKYIENVTQKDRIAIIHDTDPDGICSAVIIAKAIERLKEKKPVLVKTIEKKEITKELAALLKKKKITKLIVLDLSLDQNYKSLLRINKKIDVLIIDHHKIYSKKQMKNVLLIKPQFISQINPYEYCTAKLAYDLCSRIVDLKDIDWMAATASIADIAHKPWKSWLKKVFRKNKIRMKKDLFKTKLGQIASMISSAEVSDKKHIKKCYAALYDAKKPKDVFKKELVKIKKVVDKELKKLLKAFRRSEKHGTLHIYEINSKIEGIKSPLSTILGLKYPHKTIVIVSKSGLKAKISARRGDKEVYVNSLLEKAARGLPESNAGGHIPSAGATIRTKDYPKFKKRLIEEYSKLEKRNL